MTDELSRKIKDVQKLIQEATSVSSDKIEEYRTRILELEQGIGSLEKALADKDQLVTRLDGIRLTSELELQKKEQQILELQKELNEAGGANIQLRAQLEESQANEGQLQATVKALQMDIPRAKEQYEALLAEKEDLERELESMTRTNQAYEAGVKSAITELDQIVKSLGEHKQRVEGLPATPQVVPGSSRGSVISPGDETEARPNRQLSASGTSIPQPERQPGRRRIELGGQRRLPSNLWKW